MGSGKVILGIISPRRSHLLHHELEEQVLEHELLNRFDTVLWAVEMQGQGHEHEMNVSDFKLIDIN